MSAEIVMLRKAIDEVNAELRALRNEVRKGRANAVMPIDSDVPSRHGMFWEQWEEEQLERMYMCMVSIEDMGKRIGRSPVAIASRLEKLGLLVHVGSGVYISRKHADGQTIEQPKIFAPRSKS